MHSDLWYIQQILPSPGFSEMDSGIGRGEENANLIQRAGDAHASRQRVINRAPTLCVFRRGEKPEFLSYNYSRVSTNKNHLFFFPL